MRIMPANDSISHRGVSAFCKGHRYAPYGSNPLTLKSHASCPPEFFHDKSSKVASPPTHSDATDSPVSASDTLSTATLVNPSFESDLTDPDPTPILSDQSDSYGEKPYEKEFRSLPCQLDNKLNYLTVLIDFACRLMDDIWATPDIPSVFRYRHGANFGWTPESATLSVDVFRPRNCLSDLTPLPHFVMELLKRSRTNIPTIQTALCFLMAIRKKVADIQQAERDGNGTRGEPVNNEGRIEVDEDCLADDLTSVMPSHPSKLRKPPTTMATPLPSLPSPLLCPRRSFMGALVLAAKFVQDKCYSNRAWAKTSGLPAREVSRCERALGDALEWRLWVGKGADRLPVPSPSDYGLGRTVSCPSILDDDDTTRRSSGPSLFEDKELIEIAPSAKTWMNDESVDGAATVVVSMETEFGISPSPTPSLAYSSSSNCSSGSLSTPSLSTPSPSFASNDPWSVPRIIRSDEAPCVLPQRACKPLSKYTGKARFSIRASKLRDIQDAFDMRAGYDAIDTYNPLQR